MSKKITVLLIVALSISIFGCGKKVAEGEGWVIRDKEFKEKLSSLPPDIAAYMTTDEGQKRFIETLVLREILCREAEKEGITKDKEVLNKIESAERKVIIEEYLDRKFKDEIPVTQADIDEFYETNKDSFDNAETIRARHILLKTRDEAENILKMLKKGESFETMANEYSVGPSASRGGDLGFYKRGRMVPEFDAAAFALKKPGDISDIVQTRYGYHIIQLVDKDHLIENLQANKKKKILDNYIKDLKETAEYKIYYENLTLKKDIKKEKVEEEEDTEE
ncbi:MAG: peptidylprolyl isomerase [Deltaproteobacteria bacterium]|uniref:peptidylprolyl isomerase n=1 Tax=Candidatus Zymogenus saltonus TaxID=2844893 RepID=A0A9D8KDQ5_9DELT|nr:peptidylprolyl isomerase [Candidatus Zymogenus saltonus]